MQLPSAITKDLCEFCNHALRHNSSPIQCVNCRSKFHKKCANQISKTVISNFTTYSGIRLNQWVCHKCNNTLFPFSNLNDEELLQQYSSTDSEVRPMLRSSNKLHPDMLNSVFCRDEELDRRRRLAGHLFQDR